MSRQQPFALRVRGLFVDRLNTLPLNIIETILCLVPFREAVRTCVLSKNWRYNWTKIPKVVFDFDTLLRVVYQILLQHQGPIVEFSVCIHEDDTYVEVDQVMPYLSRMNTVKKLRLGNFRRIPLDVFLMKQLTDLYLHECYMLQQQTFNGFSNVTTLTLNEVFIYKKTLIHVLSKCPLLKTLNLLQEPQDIQSDDNSSLIELFECLPLIENLTICLWAFECFDELPRELPTSLQNLKYMCLYHVFLGGDNEYTMPILSFFSRSSPNLEKIKLRISTLKKIIIYPDLLEPDSHADEESGVSEDYSNIQLKNLNELEIENLGSKKVELEFVKLMLLMSPVLKTLKIFLNEEVAEDKELEVLNILLSCPHTSPTVKITLHRDV